MIKGVIFDMDGVILDSMGMWTDLGKRYIRSLGIIPDDNLSEILFSMSLEEAAAYLIKQYHLEKTPDRIVYEIEKMIEDYYYYEVKAKEGAEAVMTWFQKRNIPMIVATSSPRDHITKALERNHLLSYVEEILTTSEVGASKSSPDIYLLAARALGSEPGETLVFEDSLYALKTAHEAGFPTVGVHDKDGEPNQEGIRALANIYLMNMNQFEEKYSQKEGITL